MRSFGPLYLRLGLSVGLVALGAFPAPLLAEGSDRHPTVMVVVDSSNSMWGQVNGEPKIVLARRVIRDLMAQWNPGVPIGLIAYGHREEESCEDVGTVVPIGADPETIAVGAEGLRPLGRSPLTAAIEFAAETLNSDEQPATIVLVTDGVESCDLDPCQAAAALEESGERLTIHAVDLTTPNDRDNSQLQCIVEATGGDIVQPDNIASLLPDLEVFLGLRIFEAGSQTDDPRFIISPHNGRLVEVYHGEARFAVHRAPVNFLGLGAQDVFFAPRPGEQEAFDPGGVAIRFGVDDRRVLLLWWTRGEDGMARLTSHEVAGDSDLPAQILWMAPRIVRIAFGDAMRDPRVVRLETEAGVTATYQEIPIAP